MVMRMLERGLNRRRGYVSSLELKDIDAIKLQYKPSNDDKAREVHIVFLDQ